MAVVWTKSRIINALEREGMARLREKPCLRLLCCNASEDGAQDFKGVGVKAL